MVDAAETGDGLEVGLQVAQQPTHLGSAETLRLRLPEPRPLKPPVVSHRAGIRYGRDFTRSASFLASPLQAPHQACQPPFTACGGEVGEQAGRSSVEHGEPVTAGFMAQRAGQPGFAHAGRAADQHVVAVADPATRRKRLEQASVETTRRAQIGVLDDRVLSQPGEVQPSAEPLVVSRRDLTVDQQAEPSLPQAVVGSLSGCRICNGLTRQTGAVL